MKKSIISFALVLGLLVFSFGTFASAAGVTKNSSGQSFDSAWELSASGSNYLLIYGYNTDWINEDYTHTTHSIYDHIASVSNGNGAYADTAGSDQWAKIEVSHSGTYIEYSITY